MLNAAASRAAIVALLVLVASALGLALAPFDAGAIRLAGVGLLWWYAALVAPVAAALVTTVALLRGAGDADAAAALAVVAWTSPVLLACLAVRVFAGAPDAPLLALAAVVVPLLALLLSRPAAAAAPNPIGAVAGVAGIALVLGANVLLLVDLAMSFGLPRWAALTVAAATLAPMAIPSRAPRRVTLAPLVIALGGVLLPALAVAISTATPPWTAWSRLASRPAMVFGDRSPAVTAGQLMPPATSLTFTESHRVTAMSPGTYRIVERDGDHLAIREWRLAPGDALTLRPGDRLAVPEAVRVRFEVAKRVPGAPMSGVAWADPGQREDHPRLLSGLGLLVTLTVGAAALVIPLSAAGGGTPARAGLARIVEAATAPALALAFGLGGICWGIYTVYAAGDRGIATSSLSPLLWTGATLGGWRGRAAALVAAGALALMLFAAARALRDRAWAILVTGVPVGALRRRETRLRLLLSSGLAAGAVALGVVEFDPWPILILGLGLAGSAWAVPRLAGGRPTAQALGSLAGATAFVVLAVGGVGLPASAPAIEFYAALVAAPLAWAVARAGRG